MPMYCGFVGANFETVLRADPFPRIGPCLIYFSILLLFRQKITQSNPHNTAEGCAGTFAMQAGGFPQGRRNNY